MPRILVTSEQDSSVSGEALIDSDRESVRSIVGGFSLFWIALRGFLCPETGHRLIKGMGDFCFRWVTVLVTIASSRLRRYLFAGKIGNQWKIVLEYSLHEYE